MTVPPRPLPTRLAALGPHARDLATTTLDWCDQWWDESRGLPWAPDGHEAVLAGRTLEGNATREATGTAAGPPGLHLVPQSAWYAAGLLLRDGPDDRDRAARILTELCDLQYDRAGTDWHGTFAMFAESPTPPERSPVMWEDYDPNWRQFLGTAFLVILAGWEDRLDTQLVARLDRALHLAVAGEPPHRVPPSYANIALMQAWLEVGAGHRLGEADWVRRGERNAEAVTAHFRRHGCFEEYNSPTYYGVDLWALAGWRAVAASETLGAAGLEIENALWSDIGRWWHAGLGNLCPPHTRAYGMDLHAYVGKLSLWLWAAAGRDQGPLPTLQPSARHGHDLFAGAVTAVLATAAPHPGAAAVATAPPPVAGCSVDQVLSRATDGALSPDRRATGWLDGTAMLGAESCSVDLSWWDQYVGAAALWATPAGVGWLVARRDGPSRAVAGTGTLGVPRAEGAGAEVTLTLHVPGLDPADLDAVLASGRRWHLPGLDLVMAGVEGVTPVPSAPPATPLGGTPAWVLDCPGDLVLALS